MLRHAAPPGFRAALASCNFGATLRLIGFGRGFMRHHIKGGLVATLGLLSGTALVQAADLPARTAPVPVFVAPVVSDWGGFYAGSTFGTMKQNAANYAPVGGTGYWKSDAGFFDSATSAKWEGQLSEKDMTMFEARLAELVPDDKARAWFRGGNAAV